MSDAPIADDELHSAVTDLHAIAGLVKKGLADLAPKMDNVSALLDAERQKRSRLALLDAQGDILREMASAAAATHKRLDAINVELERYGAAIEEERTAILAAAREAADTAVKNARAEAANIIGVARATAAREADQHAGLMRERRAELEHLDSEIAVRQAEQARIEQLITDLKARFGR